MNKQVNVDKKNERAEMLAVYTNVQTLVREAAQTIKLSFIGGLMVGAVSTFIAMVMLK